MNYWLDLFTGTTWEEFRSAGANISGFRENRKTVAARIRPGDMLLCYMTGVMRWVGALEVIEPTKDRSRIWKDAEFPVRFIVKPVVLLRPEHGVLMDKLLGRVDFYSSEKNKGGFKGFLRGSPAIFKKREDGDLILQLLREAEKNPIHREVDARKLAKRPYFIVPRRKGKKQIKARVTVPEPEAQTEIPLTQVQRQAGTVTEGSRHTEIQYKLLAIGSQMGLDVWVARNDRSKVWEGKTLGELPRVLQDLPTQFSNEATNRTIELIDVLWLKGNSIVAAFEVECTTSVYSGILRMSDLLSLQPNLDIRLYLVAPDERREKVAQEIQRPTFAVREKPLPEICGFLPFSKLCEYVDGIQRLNLAESLRPSFLNKVAEYFDRDGE